MYIIRGDCELTLILKISLNYFTFHWGLDWLAHYFLSWPGSDFSPKIVSISSCMKAQGTVEPCSGHLSPLGQKAWNRNCSCGLWNVSGHLAPLLYNWVPAAGEAELVSDIAGTLHEVSVLQLAAAVGALEERPPAHLVAAVTRAGHLVGPGLARSGRSVDSRLEL